MAVEPDSAGVRFPPPFVYLGALLLGLAAERLVTLRSFGIDWRLLVAIGALLFVAGAAMMLAAGLFRRLGANVPPSQPTTLIATAGPYRWTRNPIYLGMTLIYAGLAIGFDGPIAFALLPLVLIAIQTQVIAREERYTVFLRIDCDFKARTDKAYFYYSLNGKDWNAIGEPLHMIYDMPHFMGYRFGLFNFATKTAGGFVDFDYMRLSDKIIAAP
ncbi:MAG: isoprenylcysteine carboxyl methyltransferase [Capsulimonas sp.]|nr:isoprenylcysteine carboxyl methyltransferase [Capsulimonas sp.]